MVITAYQVSQRSLSDLGMDTAFMQQWIILKQSSKDPVNPWKVFWRDLSAQLSTFQSNTDEIILISDANSYSEDEGIIELTCYYHGLLDLLTIINDLSPPDRFHAWVTYNLPTSSHEGRHFSLGGKYPIIGGLFVDLSEGQIFSQ